MSGAAPTLACESPRQPEVIRLIEALDGYLGALYPPESNHFLDIDALCAPDIRFFVARLEGAAVGCGALRLDAGGYGEVKRMYVAPGARGRRLGHAILRRIEDEAQAAGLSCMRLETGIYQAEALALYSSAGYRACAAFGEYQPDPLSAFMEKRLRQT